MPIIEYDGVEYDIVYTSDVDARWHVVYDPSLGEYGAVDETVEVIMFDSYTEALEELSSWEGWRAEGIL